MVLHNKVPLFETFDSKYSSSFSFYVFDLLRQSVKFHWFRKVVSTHFIKDMLKKYILSNIQYAPYSKYHYLHSFFDSIFYQVINVSVFFTLLTKQK